MNKKINIVCVLLAFSSLLFAQQPRLPQVTAYQSETGNVIETVTHIEQRYCLPMQRYKEGQNIYLGLPFSRQMGVKAVMPFGFRLSESSEVSLKAAVNNLVESDVINLYDTKYLSTVSYSFCDSVVYAMTFRVSNDAWSKIGDELDSIFSNPDYSVEGMAVYSDENYLIKTDRNKNRVEVYSLFHYPIYEKIYPGVRHKIYYPPVWYRTSSGESVMLAFLNQESKENNVQSAFKIYYKGKVPLNMKSIAFVLDNGETIKLPLEADEQEKDGEYIIEKDARVYLFSEKMQEMLRAKSIKVILSGPDRTVEYMMPQYQKYSLFTTYEYFRWQVTNPMVKYRGI